jgi:hypothetical protein
MVIGVYMEKRNRFVKIYGYAVLALSLACVLTIYFLSSIESRPLVMNYYGSAVAGWYLITGIGILSQKRWGYYLFKVFLYVLLLAFPIGTLIAYKSLSYIKRNNIKELYC